MIRSLKRVYSKSSLKPAIRLSNVSVSFICRKSLSSSNMAGESGIPQDEKTTGRINGNNGLILYSYHHSYYAQKVLLALYEKNIPFTIHPVDITKGAQYEEWYLKINPNGEVPVLKDGIKYIPDSERIIEYLEDNFSNGEHARLIPIDQGPEVKQKVIKFHKNIISISGNDITLGALINDEYSSNYKYPFVIPSVRKILVSSAKTSSAKLRDYAMQYPDFCTTLLQKANLQEKNLTLLSDKVSFSKKLNQVEQLLDEVENELCAQDEKNSDWWLCTDRFTIADISLTVLLDRLSRIGLESYFWAKGKRPHVDNYYKRVQRRSSYKKTVPTIMTDISVILKAKAPLILGVGLLTVITVVVGGFFYFKK